eukprot:Gb_24401 [translate_table: standard]
MANLEVTLLRFNLIWLEPSLLNLKEQHLEEKQAPKKEKEDKSEDEEEFLDDKRTHISNGIIIGQDDYEGKSLRMTNEAISSLLLRPLNTEQRLKLSKMHETVELGVTNDDVEENLNKLVNQRQTSNHKETPTFFDTKSKETDLTCGLDGGESSEICGPPSGPLDEEAKASTSGLGCGTLINASAQERSGRAGRVWLRKYYRRYIEEFYMKDMFVEGIPEMQRSNLVGCTTDGIWEVQIEEERKISLVMTSMVGQVVETLSIQKLVQERL